MTDPEALIANYRKGGLGFLGVDEHRDFIDHLLAELEKLRAVARDAQDFALYAATCDGVHMGKLYGGAFRMRAGMLHPQDALNASLAALKPQPEETR